jgi:tRNA(Arg) A34 adenosine deaminase TadA
MTMKLSIALTLPSWVVRVTAGRPRHQPALEDRMRLAIDLSRLNVEHSSGGPFGAAIFDAWTYELVALGVNLVVPASCSVAHAEMVTIMLAQSTRGTFDLGAPGLPPHELVTSTEPCAMCLGAVPWSGVRRLVCGARDEDARRVGFDEGHKPARWPDALERRGIAVTRDVCRDEARRVLEAYVARGSLIYNGTAAEMS